MSTKLIPEWRRVLLQAWSSRLAILAGVLSAAEVGLQYVYPDHSSPAFALGAAALSFAAALARVVAQPTLWTEEEK